MKKRILALCLACFFILQLVFPTCGPAAIGSFIDLSNHITGIRVVGSTSTVESEKVSYDNQSKTVEYASQTPGSVIALIDTPDSYRDGVTYTLTGEITVTGFSQTLQESNAGVFLSYRMDTPVYNQPLLHSSVSLQQDLSIKQLELYWANTNKTSVNLTHLNAFPNSYTANMSYDFSLQLTADGYVVFKLNQTTILNTMVTENDISPQFALIFNYATARLENLHLEVGESPTQHITGMQVYTNGFAQEASKVSFDLDESTLSYQSQTPGSLFAMLETDQSFVEGNTYTLSGTISQTGFAQPPQGWYSAAVVYRYSPQVTNNVAFYSAASLWQSGSINQVELYWADANKTAWDFVEYNTAVTQYQPGQNVNFELTITADRKMLFKLDNTLVFEQRMSHNDLDLQFGFLFNYSTVEISNLRLDIKKTDRGIDGIEVAECSNQLESANITYDIESGTLGYHSESPATAFVTFDTCKDCTKAYKLTGTFETQEYAVPTQSWYNMGFLYRYTPTQGSSPGVYSGVTVWQNQSVNSVELYWTNQSKTAADFSHYAPIPNICVPGNKYDFELIITEYNKLFFYIEDQLLFEESISENEIERKLGILFLNSDGEISNLILTELPMDNRNITDVSVVSSLPASEAGNVIYNIEEGEVIYQSQAPGDVTALLSSPFTLKKGKAYTLTGTLTHNMVAQENDFVEFFYRFNQENTMHPDLYSSISLFSNGNVMQKECFWLDEALSSTGIVEQQTATLSLPMKESYSFVLSVNCKNIMTFQLDGVTIVEAPVSDREIDIKFGLRFHGCSATVSDMALSEQVRVENAQVLSDNGIPALYINDHKMPMMMFTQWMAAQKTNEYNNYPNYIESQKYAGITIYQPRVEGAVGVNTWAPYLNQILAEDPDALFVLPIWVQSGDVLNLSGTTHMDSSAPGVYSIGSLTWLDHAKTYVTSFVEGFMNSQYADRIVGFMVTAGNTGEWFDINTYQNPSPDFDRCQDNIEHFRIWLAEKYQTDTALQTAWNNTTVTLETANIPQKFISDGPMLDPLEHQDLIDFMIYDSEMVVDAIQALCNAIKLASNGTRVAGAPYGYTMETGKFNNISGSLSFDRLLDMDNIDFVCSPLSYQHRDLADYAGWHGFADSVKSHGKLWISEDDTVTHLSTQSQYDWYRHIDMQASNTQAILWKNFMAAYTKRMGCWWYDNYGQGAFNSPEILSDINLMQQLYSATNKWTYESTTEVALVLDEKSQFYQTPGVYWESGETFNNDLLGMRKNLGIAGAPVDVISLEDICSGDANEYKVYIFANAFVLDSEHRAAIEGLKRNSKSLVFIKLPAMLDPDTKVPSLINAAALTEFDLRLAVSSAVPPVQMGYQYVDMAGNLTEVPISNFYSSFSLTNRQHMYAQLRAGETSLLNCSNGKAIVAKSAKSNWISYYADNMNLLTPQMLRSIYAEAGVFVYSDNNRNIQADANFVSVTVTDDDSTEAVFLPIANGEVYEITTGNVYPVNNYAVTISSGEAHTFVFYLGVKENLPIFRATPLCKVAAKIYANGGKKEAYIPVYQSMNISAYLANKNNVFLNVQPSLSYSVENPAIAAITSNGKVTGLSKGETSITIRFGSLKTIVRIHVV